MSTSVPTMSTKDGTSLQYESDSSISDSLLGSKDLNKQFKTDYTTETDLSLYAVDPPAFSPYWSISKTTPDADGDRLKRCYLANPDVPDLAKPDVNLTLVELLHGGIRSHITQVWTASITYDRNGSLEGKLVIAKFFDPLYYFQRTSTLDALLLVDRRLHNEHKSYNKLRSLQGTMIPEFFGIFVAAFPPPVHLASSEAPASRNVYVILLEYVDGVSLDKIQRNPNKIKKQPISIIDQPDAVDRVRIMDDVLEAEAHAAFLGVLHQDFVTRNFVLRSSWKQEAGSKVVMIDFEDITEPEVSPEKWDPSEDARVERIKKKRADRFFCSNYPGWDGWL